MREKKNKSWKMGGDIDAMVCHPKANENKWLIIKMKAPPQKKEMKKQKNKM